MRTGRFRRSGVCLELRHDERGIVLIMALGVMLVLTLALTTVIHFSSSSARHASRSNAGESAYALAETGINNAASVLYAAPTTQSAGCNNDASDYDWSGINVPAGSGGTTWSATLWSGSTQITSCTLTAGTYTWRVTGTGSRPNPTGPGAADVVRTLTRTFTLTIVTTPLLINAVWNGNEGGSTLSCGQSGVTLIGLDLNNVNIRAPFISKGDVCLRGSSTITGSTYIAPTVTGGTDGRLALKTAANKIGTAATPVSDVNVVHGCYYVPQSPSANHTPCLGGAGGPTGDNVFATNPIGTTVPPAFLNRPVYDWQAKYNAAAPGPMRTPQCDVLAGSPPDFDLNDTWTGAASGTTDITTAASYTCRACPTPGSSCTAAAAVGELSWDVTAKKLMIKGTIYFDTNFADTTAASSGVVHYVGKGMIFFSGKGQSKWQGGETWCARPTGTAGYPDDCKAGTALTVPTLENNLKNWDPTVNALWLLMGGKNRSADSGPPLSWAGTGDDLDYKLGAFQGAVYTVNMCHTHDTGYIAGPLMCGQIEYPAGTPSFVFPAVELEGGSGASTITLTANSDQSG